MGVGVSSWRLAQAVSKLGQLGVVSGTALDQVLIRRLQDGDPGGHMRRGLDSFPFPAMAERVWQTFYIDGGKSPAQSYATVPPHVKDDPRFSQELLVVANFVEVFLSSRRAFQSNRHQLYGEAPDSASAVHLRRDAGGRRIHFDGRRHPAAYSRRAGSLRAK